MEMDTPGLSNQQQNKFAQ